MKAWLLDTSALLVHYLDEPGADRVQEILDDEKAEVLVSAISITEFARRLSALGADTVDSRNIALEYMGLATHVVPVDVAVSIRAFEIAESCTSRLPLADSLIASSASLGNATLVHRDAHFKDIPAYLLPTEEL